MHVHVAFLHQRSGDEFYFFIADNISISMYIMCVVHYVSFRRVGPLQISIIIIICMYPLLFVPKTRW